LLSKRELLSILILICLVMPLFFSTFPSSAKTKVSDLVKDITKDINIQNIQKHVKNLSSFPSRVTGYPGFYNAAEYIIGYLRSLPGMRVEIQNYSVMIPMSYKSSIDVPELGLTFQAFPLWPNGIQPCSTPEDGINGHLVYGGSGSLEDLDGKEISGSIVLLEFNSMDNWKNAVKLGAKAIIFIEPTDTSRIEAEKKFLLTPLNVPRLYIDRKTGLKLKHIALSSDVIVSVKSNITWQEVTVPNIIGILPGEEIQDEIIIFSAHYDSWSVVPSIAPGAEDAISPASLLEFARVLSNHPPKRTVWFVFYSGHWQALAGAREFAEEYLFQNATFSSGQKKILLQLSIYLSSESNLISWTNIGDMYLQPEESTPYGWDGLINLLFQKYIPNLHEILNEDPFRFIVNPITDSFATMSEILDSEPISATGILSLTFLTARTLKLNWQTPLNTIEEINWKNVNTQLKIIFYIFSSLINENLSGNPIITRWKPPSRRIITGVGSDIGPGQAGFITLIGSVEEYELTTGFYKPVPNAFVEVYLSTSMETEAVGEAARSNMLNPYTHIYTRADDSGRFVVHGLAADSLFAYYNVLGYVLDLNSGSIIYAPDLGLHGAGGGIYGGYHFLNIEFDRHPFFLKTIVFRCESITLFDILNPLVIKIPRKASHFYTSDAVMLDISTTVNEFLSHHPPEFYGLISYPEGLQMIFLPSNITFELTLTTSTGIVVGVLNNASQHHPAGAGFSSKIDEIPATAFSFVRDLMWINEHRLSILKDYHFINPMANNYHTLASEYMEIAIRKFQEKKYSEAYSLIYMAWQNAVNAYREITQMSHDVVNATIVFYALIIPFAYLFERLAFNAGGRKRLFIIIALLSFFTLLAYFMLPGFKIASNIFVSILGITILILIIPVQSIIFFGIISFLKFLRKLSLRAHFSEISRGSAFILSLSLGLSNMRRRLLRTTLNLVTVILFTSALVSLTSFSMHTIVRSFSITGETMYNGMLLKQNVGLTPFSEGIIQLLRTYLGENATIAVRSWIYPPPAGREEWLFSWRAGMGSWIGRTQNVAPPLTIYGPNGTQAKIKGLLGLQPEEAKITGINGCLVKGRWFNEYDINAVIISQDLKDKLNVNVGDTLDFMGLKLHIIGIINDLCLENIKDLDQRGLNPMDVSSTPFATATTFIPMSLKNCLIIPYRLASQYFDGRINSIAVKLNNLTKAKEVAKKTILGAYSMLEIYVGSDGIIDVYRLSAGLVFKGWESLIPAIVIAGLTLFTTMLGSIHERLREIATLSTLGLSPLHISGIFLAEFAMYAIIGTILGYMLGMVLINILYCLQLVPAGFSVNLSSSATLFTLFISSLAVMAAALYPSLKASHIVTPSLTRKWEVKTKPVGNKWYIPLPFRVPEDEVRGVMAYLYEYFKIHTARDVGIFRVSKMSYEETEIEGNPAKILSAEVALAPWDSGIAQLVQIIAKKDPKGKEFSLDVALNRIRGSSQIWVSKNRDFVRSIRNQLILWNTLEPEEKRQYAKRKFETDR